MLDETVLTSFLEKGEYIYAKNSWLSGKNAQRAQEAGITPKKKAYVRRNAPWSKARMYKSGMKLNQMVNTLVFKQTLAEVKDELGVSDPIKAVRAGLGFRVPRETKSRAKPTAVLKKEVEDELKKLPPEARKLFEEKMAAVRARIEAYKRQASRG
jgi:hypothetical protein